MSNKVPDTIHLSIADAELFAQKYGHPDMEWVEPEQDHVRYVREDLDARSSETPDSSKAVDAPKT